MTRYVSAEGREADDFGQKFTMEEGEHMYDAITVMGPWACMSEASFLAYGIGRLGLGLGQKYRRDNNGHLVKVEG